MKKNYYRAASIGAVLLIDISHELRLSITRAVMFYFVVHNLLLEHLNATTLSGFYGQVCRSICMNIIVILFRYYKIVYLMLLLSLKLPDQPFMTQYVI